MKVKIKLLSADAVIPSRAHDTDSGYDITMTDIEKIEGDVMFFKTGIKLEIPEGYYFEVFPRSSISGLPVSLANSVGVIDQSYRGELKIPLRLHHTSMGQDISKDHYPSGLVRIFNSKPPSIVEVAKLILKNKPVIAQLILKKRIDCEFEEVDQLGESERGEGGFGSSDSGITKASVRRILTKE